MVLQPLSHSVTQSGWVADAAMAEWLRLSGCSSHSATQPLWMTEWLSGCSSQSATLPEWLQPPSHSATQPERLDQPLSHSVTQSGWVGEWLRQPLCQSGWVAASISRAVLHIHSIVHGWMLLQFTCIFCIFAVHGRHRTVENSSNIFKILRVSGLNK